MSKPKFACTVSECGKVFTTKQYLQTHLQAHKDLDKGIIFKCKFCKKILKSRRTHKLHIIDMHINPKPKKIWKPSAPLTSNQIICYFCGKYVSILKSHDHLRLHLRETPFSCSLCKNISFSSTINLWHHQKKIHPDFFNEKQKRAKEILKIYKSSSSRHEGRKKVLDLEKSRDHHKSDTKFSWQCPINCGKRFESKGGMDSHIISFHTNERCYKCIEPGCEKLYKTGAGLRDHVLFIHSTPADAKGYGCEMCSKSFKFERLLKFHVKYTHLRMRKVHKCPHCEEGFQDSARFKTHIAEHTGIWPFPCNMCSAKFATKHRLESHLICHSSEGDKIFECTICKKKFAHKWYLTSHNKNHHSKTPRSRHFPCLICSKSFYDQGALTNHSKTHSSAGEENCYFCGKRGSKGNLMEHLRIHTEEKPYRCPQFECNYSARMDGSLRCHMRKHLGQVVPKKKTKCYFCDRDFSQLSVHMRIHTMELPYKCGLCNLAFKGNSSLWSHLTIVHTKEKPFKCEQCGIHFTYAHGLKKHKFVAH